MFPLQDIGGAIQKVFLLEPTEERKNASGKTYGVTCVLAKSTNYSQVHDLFVPQRFIKKFNNTIQHSILIRKYTQKEEGSISLSESSTIMDTTDDISQPHIKRYTNPDIADIATIKTKEKNERVSLQGIVQKATKIIETSQSSRKIVTVSDSSGEIDIKFWSTKTNVNPFEAGTMLVIKSVKVDHYGGKASLNSTPSTTVEVKEDLETLEGKVEAACFDDDNMSIMVENSIFNISRCLMERIYPTLKFTPGKIVMAIASAYQITDLVEVNNDHED
eukprot:XP_011414729.1 PREDICTED: uncharacterized protein LOC105319042 [Crassostrea gigas]